jgi:hypothetical protein
MTVLADMGLPMIFIELPCLVLALLPVAAAEAVIYRARLALPYTKALGGSLIANLCSTILGVPISWFVLVVAEMSVGGGSRWGVETPLMRIAAVTVQAPWLMPYEAEFYWMIPAASLFLMLPFFLASVLTERWVLLRWWRGMDPRRLTVSVWQANLLSYGALAAYWAWRLTVAQPRPIA